MQTVNGFGDMVQQYIGQNILYIFAIFAWFLLLSQWKKQERRVALMAALLLLAAVFNPWSYQLLVSFTKQRNTYYRFFWLIPCEGLAAFFIYESLQKIRNLKHRLLLVSGICIGLLCISTSKENWKLPENSYQLSFDILEVAEQLKDLRTESGQDQITIIADTNISNVIRQYDGNICLPLANYQFGGMDGTEGEVPAVMVMLMNNQEHLDAAMVKETLASNEVDYLVISINNDISLSYMQRLHWQIAVTTSAYHILQYQEPVFHTEPLTAAGLETEEVEVVIPGLTEEYHFLFLADLHIITENNEISPSELENIQSRLLWSSVSDGTTAAEYWGMLPDILDSCSADAVLFGGDMIDFCSSSNVACLKQGLDRIITPYLYVRADHDLKPYWCQGITEEQCQSLHNEIDTNPQVWCMKLPELCVAGINNSTEQISENALQQMKEIFSKGKPVILLTHVPFQSLVDDSLQEASKEVWQDRALV